MTIRNLDFFFRPKSIAVVGASIKEGSVGRVLMRNLLRGGFEGPILPVHPQYRAVEGVLAYRTIAELPLTPELAVVATPASTVPEIVTALSTRGTRAVVVLSAGFGPAAAKPMRDQSALRDETLDTTLLDAARPNLVRIIGPNCLGLIVPSIGLNASFAHASPRPGRIGFVTQSGAIINTMIDWADSRGVGFSKIMTLGDMLDVDFGDALDYLADDPETRAVLLYVESVTNPRKFISAARAAARSKPLVCVKGGRTPEGAKAARAHSGAIEGQDAVFDAVFRRIGALRVFTLEELFDAAEILDTPSSPAGDRLAILTNGGGVGVLVADAVVLQQGRLAALSAETIEGLSKVLPGTSSFSNPIDIDGDATAIRYRQALDVLLKAKEVDGIVVLHCPSGTAGTTGATEAARAVVDACSRQKTGRPVLTSWVGSKTVEEARQVFVSARIPTYDTPEQAARAFLHLVNYRKSREALMETPRSQPAEFEPDLERARRPIMHALLEERTLLTEPEAQEVIAAYGIPVPQTHFVETSEDAVRAARVIGGPVVLKVVSPDILHKTDVGGVLLDVEGDAAVREASEAMAKRVQAACPSARIRGLVVQELISRRGSQELQARLTLDPIFGPVVWFGQGGTLVDLLKDHAVGLPPLNMHLAKEIISRTRIAKILEGHRDHPAIDLDSVAVTLIRIAQLAIDIPEIIAIDVNPLLADQRGVIALDVKLHVRQVDEGRPFNGSDRTAIRPYPKELEATISLRDGRRMLVRPILPEDEPPLHAMIAAMSPEQLRLRFFVPVRTLTHMAAARFTQIDYDREMTLVTTQPGVPGTKELYGVVSLQAGPNNERAEYSILVRQDMTGLGLGYLLMRHIIEYAKSRRIRQIYGDVLRENAAMLRVCRGLGFSETAVADEPTMVRVELSL